MIYEEILKMFQFPKNSEKDISNSDEMHINNFIESYYNSIFLSLVNKVKANGGNYNELNHINKFKKDIMAESRNQYKFIISYCKKSEIDNMKTALKKYNFLHLLKFTIKILDIDEDYSIKINECKRYFNNEENIKIVKYLYNHNEVPRIELKQFTGTSLDRTSHLNDLITIKRKENSQIYSLSTKGKNLYAFFMMKHIDVEKLETPYNEDKINEVLEYLIQYLLTQQNRNQRSRLKKPILNSTSANYNFDKLISLLDKEDNYSQDFFQKFSDQEIESYAWDGGRMWKTY